MSDAALVLTVFIVVIFVVGGLWYIATMNRFARLVVKIAEADSGIDVGLTKRFDTLTKMLDVTKAYAKHESETLATLVSLRKGMSMVERSEANRQMDGVESRINLLAEAYPELRSSDNFRELQKAVAEVEDHLQAARRIYNMNVSSFNQLLVSFPASIVGNIHKHTAKEFFEADEKKKEDVKMEF
jgi:LemA protein